MSACPCDRGGNVGGGSRPRKNPNREETEAIRTRYLQKEKKHGTASQAALSSNSAPEGLMAPVRPDVI